MKQKDIIIKITFSNDTMMFGNSYKSWEEQVEEYMRRSAKDLEKPSKVEISSSKFISWGGLKWCSENKFQYLLNREGCQYDELDNPNPRQYSDIKFTNAEQRIFDKVIDLWRSGQRLLKINQLNNKDYALYEKGKLRIKID